MTDTPRMSLPLLVPAQAQKHVTVNEALTRIDALTHLTLVSASITMPPATVEEGVVYAVPTGAMDAWSGQSGNLALGVNGGWVFVPPQRGWQAMLLDEGAFAVWDGAGWRIGAVTLSPSGAGMAFRAVEIVVPLGSESTLTTHEVIPARAILFGVTGLVIEAITGSVATWSLGVDGDIGRFGTGLGLGPNSWVNGPAAPIVYWSPTALTITAEGGAFSGGVVRLVVHYAELSLPSPVASP